MNQLKQRSLDLMKKWCDSLLSYQVENKSEYLDGALLCPACHVVHGRIADLCYPLTTLYIYTGEKRYLDAADKFIDWTEYNLKRPDGSYNNDAGSVWKGITAFSATAIGDCLYHFADKLPPKLASKWRDIFVRLSDFCHYYFDSFNPNINYFAGAACELALALKITGDKRYLDKANHWERFCRDYFDENGLFYGEGKPLDLLTDKGCRAIDIGYNLEESMPLLLRHAILTENEDKIDFYKARMIDHLEFLLPDGALDNSFGTRHNKWTYWGSRTSDGVAEGLALMLDDPRFAKACDLVVGQYEACTHDGLLVPPMQSDAGEPPCLHHSFCHAKALAAVVNAEAEPADFSDTVLSCETEYGVKSFQSGNLLLVSKYGWRATFSSIDIVFYRGAENYGGSMNLLWHKSTGPICAATMHEYVPSEPLNMQYLRHSDSSPCMTPRIVIGNYSSDCDKSVLLTHMSYSDKLIVNAHGEDWWVDFSFAQNKLTIEARCDRSFDYYLPLICDHETEAVLSDNRLTVGQLSLTCDGKLSADTDKRVYNQVGGFEYLPVKLSAEKRFIATLELN